MVRQNEGSKRGEKGYVALYTKNDIPIIHSKQSPLGKKRKAGGEVKLWNKWRCCPGKKVAEKVRQCRDYYQRILEPCSSHREELFVFGVRS